MFQLQSLDHVAINAVDPERSAAWYAKAFGLKRVQPPEWKPFPIFMLSDNFGVAIFKQKNVVATKQAKKIDHFAFRVSQSGFAAAQIHLTGLNVTYKIQDHLYFHSLYCSDPDGNTVELTTFIKNFPPTSFKKSTP
jgi:catechol 2,3-dioxygenase-like lactoylglutathione lyase family enzyme